MRIWITAAIFALGAATCAHADTSARMAQQLALYEKYAGAPIERFPMVNLWQWQAVGKEKVVVWSMVNKAYLITVYKPCIDLDWTPAIGIKQNSSMHVDAKFDAIVFDHQHCRIQEIRPIDYKALRADEKAAKDAKSQDSGGE
ncbi:MAG: hypothetical protein JSR27_04245 [Proteobacteria bacterium]|nr:hypothetical protein [Pseudomonadota bacterium]